MGLFSLFRYFKKVNDDLSLLIKIPHAKLHNAPLNTTYDSMHVVVNNEFLMNVVTSAGEQ